jgi:hypothetical protein
MSKRDRLGLTPDLTTRDLWRSRRWARERGNEKFCLFVPVGLQAFFTCRKILRHGTFPLYFPSERKVCCGFLSPLKIHRLGRVLSPQASTLTTIPPRRPKFIPLVLNITLHIRSLIYIQNTQIFINISRNPWDALTEPNFKRCIEMNKTEFDRQILVQTLLLPIYIQIHLIISKLYQQKNTASRRHVRITSCILHKECEISEHFNTYLHMNDRLEFNTLSCNVKIQMQF